jgi:hypothetical protein
MAVDCLPTKAEVSAGKGNQVSGMIRDRIQQEGLDSFGFLGESGHGLLST